MPREPMLPIVPDVVRYLFHKLPEEFTQQHKKTLEDFSDQYQHTRFNIATINTTDNAPESIKINLICFLLLQLRALYARYTEDSLNRRLSLADSANFHRILQKTVLLALDLLTTLTDDITFEGQLRKLYSTLTKNAKKGYSKTTRRLFQSLINAMQNAAHLLNIDLTPPSSWAKIRKRLCPCGSSPLDSPEYEMLAVSAPQLSIDDTEDGRSSRHSRRRSSSTTGRGSSDRLFVPRSDSGRLSPGGASIQSGGRSPRPPSRTPSSRRVTPTPP